MLFEFVQDLGHNYFNFSFLTIAIVQNGFIVNFFLNVLDRTMDELGLKPFATPVRNAKKNEDCDGQQNFAAPLINGNMDPYKKYKLLKKHLNFLKNWLALSLDRIAFSR